MLLLQMALFHFFGKTEQYSVAYSDVFRSIPVYHIFFIHSYVSGHFGCFYVLAAMNMGMCVSFQIRVLSTYMSQSGIAGSHDNSTFSFLRNLHICFPQWLHQLTFSPSIIGRFPFSPPSLAFVICRLLNDGHSDWGEKWYLIVTLYTFL